MRAPTIPATSRLPLLPLASFLRDRLAFVAACAREGDAVVVRLGPKRALVLSHPELIREVFVREATHFGRGISGTIMRPVVGEGLLLAEGEVWRRQRRDVQPLLGVERTADLMP